MVQRSVIAVLLALSSVGCGTPATPAPPGSAAIIGPVTAVGSPEVRDLPSTTETVSNCGGNVIIVKHPSVTVITNHTIEWEVGGELGIGVTIGEGVIPGGVNLSGAFDSHIISGSQSGIEQSTAWDLPAQPNTKMEYTLSWREIWQPGVVQVRLADQSLINVGVRYRTGIQSDIVGQQQLSCDSDQGQLPTETVPIATTTLTAPTVPPTPIPNTEPATIPNTEPGTILSPGDVWYEDGLAAFLSDAKLQYDGITVPVTIQNNTSETILFNWDYGINVVVRDNLGNNFDLASGETYSSVALPPSENQRIFYRLFWGPVTDSNVSYVEVIIRNMSRINEAVWHIPVNH